MCVSMCVCAFAMCLSHWSSTHNRTTAHTHTHVACACFATYAEHISSRVLATAPQSKSAWTMRRLSPGCTTLMMLLIHLRRLQCFFSRYWRQRITTHRNCFRVVTRIDLYKSGEWQLEFPLLDWWGANTKKPTHSHTSLKTCKTIDARGMYCANIGPRPTNTFTNKKKGRKMNHMTLQARALVFVACGYLFATLCVRAPWHPPGQKHKLHD